MRTSTVELRQPFAREPLCQCVAGNDRGKDHWKRELFLVLGHCEHTQVSWSGVNLKLWLDAQCLHYLPHAVGTEVNEQQCVIICHKQICYGKIY